MGAFILTIIDFPLIPHISLLLYFYIASVIRPLYLEYTLYYSTFLQFVVRWMIMFNKLVIWVECFELFSCIFYWKKINSYNPREKYATRMGLTLIILNLPTHCKIIKQYSYCISNNFYQTRNKQSFYN